MNGSDFAKGTAVVTGASSGIGAIYADRLARRGYDVVLVARDKARLEALAERLQRAHAIAATPWRADLDAPDDLDALAERLRTDRDIAMLVNCAGLGPSGKVLDVDPRALDRLVRLNVDALHTLSVAAAGSFASRRRGAIVNIASVVALMQERFNASYVGAKAFVLGFSQALAAEVEPQGVRVQAVLPGFTRTELFGRAGVDIGVIPVSMMMDAGEMVDAALAGFDLGETVTIPSLDARNLWDEFERARQALTPHLSKDRAAARYGAHALEREIAR